jgi:hypothetical protein
MPTEPLPLPEGSADYYARQFADRIRQVRKPAPAGNHRRAIALIVFLVSVALAVFRVGQTSSGPSPKLYDALDPDSSWQRFHDMQDQLRRSREPGLEDGVLCPPDRPEDAAGGKP